MSIINYSKVTNRRSVKGTKSTEREIKRQTQRESLLFYGASTAKVISARMQQKNPTVQGNWTTLHDKEKW